MGKGLHWQPLGVPFALAPVGQLIIFRPRPFDSWCLLACKMSAHKHRLTNIKNETRIVLSNVAHMCVCACV